MRFISAFLAFLYVLAYPAQAGSKTILAKTVPPSPQNVVEPKANAKLSESVAPKPDPVEAATRTLNEAWAEIFYRLPSDSQAEPFKALLPRIREFKAQYPNRAEPLILEAITLCTLAGADWGFDSLSRISEARQLLEKSIGINPKAMESTAYITLGNLYYRLPGWPISFGDDEQARKYLEAAVKLYPDGLDANYFFGDYWLNEDKFEEAASYLEKAEKAPIRPEHQLSDTMIKKEIDKALKAAKKHDNGRDDFFSQISPDFSE